MFLEPFCRGPIGWVAHEDDCFEGSSNLSVGVERSREAALTSMAMLHLQLEAACTLDLTARKGDTFSETSAEFGAVLQGGAGVSWRLIISALFRDRIRFSLVSDQ